MGLDQYAFASAWSAEELSSKEDDRQYMEQIAYWRKHNRLQGWMENRWSERTGNDDLSDFNYELFQLHEDDIEALEIAIKNRELPETQGFFYGTDSYVDYEKWYASQDHMFIEKAKQLLGEGLNIFYRCWW